MNKFMKKIMSKKDGFTLVELIVVIAILAILAGVAVPAYSAYIKSANEGADVAALDAYKTAVQAAMVKAGEVTKVVFTKDTVTATVGGSSYVLAGTGSDSDANKAYATEFKAYIGDKIFAYTFKQTDKTKATWEPSATEVWTFE